MPKEDTLGWRFLQPEASVVWYAVATALIFVSPFAIGLGRACLLLAVMAVVVALVTYAEGGMPGCFVLFECRSGEAYGGLISGFTLSLVLLIYFGVALAAPLVQLLHLLGIRHR